MEGFHYSNESYEDNGKTGYQDKQKYKVRDITYTPDFVDPNGKWVIEVKELNASTQVEDVQETVDPPVLFVPQTRSKTSKQYKRF